MSSKIKKYSVNFGISLLALLVILLLAEGAVRLFADTDKYQFCDSTDAWTIDDSLGWRNKPGYSTDNYLFGQLVHFETNQDGLRPANISPEKKPGVKRIILVGNSTVAGRSVGEKETIHFYLDSILNKDGQRFEVINAAVEGYSTDQVFLQLKRLIKKYQPDYVGYGFCNNDLFGNFKKEDAGLNKPYFEPAADGYILHLPAKDTIRQIGGRFIEDKILKGSALFGYLRPSIYKLRAKMNKEQERVEGIDPEVYLNRSKYEKEFGLLTHLLVGIESMCRENNVRFFFYAHPGLKSTWQPYRDALGITAPPAFCEDALSEIARPRDIRFVRMVDYFMKNQAKGPFHLLPFDGHCNGKGYQLQAEVISGEISQIENAISGAVQ